MNKIDSKRKSFPKSGKHPPPDYVQVVEDMENRLRQMGIKITRPGPRLPAPGHEKGPAHNKHYLLRNHKGFYQ